LVNILYAIGEILLVVIGILIALQINNSNERRKTQILISTYAQSLVGDLRKDIGEAEYRKQQIEHRIKILDSTFSYFRDKSIQEINNIDILFTLGGEMHYRPLTWYKSSIDELKSSGNLRHIENDSLKQLISQYYSFLDHLREDYNVDFTLVNSVTEEIRRIADFNYPQVLLDSIDEIRRALPFNEWFNSELYQEANNYDLILLTNNMNDIRVIINHLKQMRRNLGYRMREYPRAIDYADRIIKIIKSEYFIE
jgi:hypothetical protein